ncbi:S53 family peptidase [Amnibacterium sp. CER49]|uniref:S53 family peptidase n=1 Tax=Amnibacterium sp. CER49 TaxID=3039161 RepID=UPI00244CB459|nr:S53 family peptidase [Amnibacterium sp. CER49]MDH2442778.1 S53 family peptidase [Amnibacterium sp. CER49]
MSVRRTTGVSVAAVGALLIGGALPAMAATHPSGAAHRSAEAALHSVHVCTNPQAGHAACQAEVTADSVGKPMATTGPTGLAPATIKSVYGFPTSSTAGSGQTIAIVNAYDDPTAEADLQTFSTQFGLPGCTSASGCFTKLNQSGKATTYPASDPTWALETSLDLQWAHAVAPAAKLVLVEATSSSLGNLTTAVRTAATKAGFVSNSWGAPETSTESSLDTAFQGRGISYFVAAGDSGLPAQYPSASPYVVSVGGTTLHFDTTGAFSSETGWSSSGGGCSLYESAPAAQSAFAQYAAVGCAGKRATPDVSLDADPASGVAVYDSTPYSGTTGWFTVGGTSAATPMWAARSAIAGTQVTPATVYGSSLTFRDITSGNNGAAAGAGYDLNTGRGSRLG